MSPSSDAVSRLDVGVVLAAGGVGERAGEGGPKQFRPIAGVPMLLRALRRFAHHPRVHQIVVVLPAAWAATPPPWLAEVLGQRLRVVPGGATRADSVAAGLQALAPECGVVLVHDAARPFVSTEEIDAVIAAAGRGVGAVSALPLADTLKQTDGARRVTATVPRATLWRAQTPQGFPRVVLEDAYRHARERGGLADATDDASLVEAAGGRVEVVPGRSTNFKVTTPDDFLLAEAVARR
ncbi:MAG TPA: 2-C-methyl-D-erythritol 4-phosphate cytidylyltransferase [Gemmatimonadales bacterium]|nr:2-C-methyl-D-erythritol 4-phosphate cytidylyltransferase [Gemmatimonadales bacterium]